MGYLEKHKITGMLNQIVNELVVEQPDDPISYLINGLLKEANARGQEPALLQRLVEVKQTLLKDQKDAAKVQKEKETLEAEVTKHKYRITHLCKTLDEFEAKGVAAPAAAPASSAVAGVPLGHTPFSWSGGVVLAAPSAPASAPAAASSGCTATAPLAHEPFSVRVSCVKVIKHGAAGIGQEVTVSGWARTVRVQKGMAFVKLSDGSCLAELQLVVEKGSVEGWDIFEKEAATGCAIQALCRRPSRPVTRCRWATASHC